KFVDYAEMQDAVKQGAILLDVRSQDEYEVHHIDGSVNAPFFSLRMQLKSLSHEKLIVVVCRDGKMSEAAAFLLLRHKIEAIILRGGMESLVPKSEVSPEPENEVPVPVEPRPESFHQESERKQSVEDSVTAPISKPSIAAVSTNVFEGQVNALKLENEALRVTNQQLKDNCMKLEFDKQNAEKQCRVLHKQMEKLTQVLDKLKGG
ncbi:MAG: rhodanese-like domain-containing protein, partial [Methylobacter sp.]|nr:rhodanese-like domain-containing protein [Methylobacter sp.]